MIWKILTLKTYSVKEGA